MSERAATYIAVTLFTLWRLQRDSFRQHMSYSEHAGQDAPPISIAYCGAVIDQHPTVRWRCQQVLDVLVEAEHSQTAKRRLVLEAALDSGLLGVAVGALQYQSMEPSSLPFKL